MKKKFTMIDDEFICDFCDKKVEKLNYTARDHCPYCLCSKHVDINPGDREENCHGKLIPIEVEKFKDNYKIIYRCEKCGCIRKNVMAIDDDFDVLLTYLNK